MSIDVEMLTVGPVAENCFLLRQRGLRPRPPRRPRRGARADPRRGRGERRDRRGDPHHPLPLRPHRRRRAGGRGDRRPGLLPRDRDADARRHHGLRPVAGDSGPYESYEADETLSGGETLELAGLELDVIFTPGHSPGHVTYSVRDEDAIFSGDVLFQGSVGRVDLPGGDGPTLLQSIRTLVDAHSRGDRRLPRAHGVDDARRRAATNPFLAELAR